jgi:hypothetical protein
MILTSVSHVHHIADRDLGEIMHCFANGHNDETHKSS